MRTKTIIAISPENLDEAIGNYTENKSQRDPDEIHFQYDTSSCRYIALLVWRSASRPNLYSLRGKR